MNNNKWIKKQAIDLTDKLVVLTGATGGLGETIVDGLLSAGAKVVLACRSTSKAEILKAKMQAIHSGAEIDIIELDLADKKSVDNAVEELKKYDGIDILINNAGVYNVPIKTLDSGYNNIFQINFLYTYYLTRELLPELQKKPGSRCITLGSVAHNYSKLNESNIDFSGDFKPSKIYGNSKRFLMGALYELFKDSDVALSIVHPGVTLTNMTNHYPKAINWLVKIGIKLFFPPKQKAIRSVLLGTKLETPYLHWIGPKLFNVWGAPKLSRLNTINEQECKKIHEIAESIMKRL